MNNNWFRRLLLSYLPVFFIVTTILFIVFFQVFNEQNRKEALKANEFLGSQVMQYLDNSLRSIDFKVLREMLTNPSLKNYFANSPLDDVTAAIQAVGVMDELKLESPLIHSIYLVRDRDNTVLSNGKRIPLEDFPDAAFIKASRDHHVQRWEGARDFKAFPSQTPVRVMTLVRGESTGEDGLVVVNVDLPTVEKTILQMYDPNFTFVHVLNRAGEALWEPGNPGKAGSAKLSKGEVFSEFTSSYGGWKVQTGLANGKVVKFALEFYTVWFAFAIVVVLIGVAWVIYVTRRNYKPIQQIVTLIQTVASQKKPGPERLQENEFRFIQTTLESMIDQTRQYRQTYEENLILQKKYFFQELLEGTKAYDKEEFRAEMDKFHLPFLDSLDNRWTAAVVEMDRYRQFTEDYHEQDQSLLKFVLSTVLQETAQQAGTEVWAEWLSDRRLTAMLWVKENRPPGLFEQKLLSTYREWVEQNLGFTVTIGVGKQAEDLTGLRESLKEANHALAYKAALGCNRILPRSEVPDTNRDVYGFLQTISRLVQAMRLSEDEWEKHFDHLFQQMKSSVLSRQEIWNTMELLVQHYEREFGELSREYQELWADSLQELLKNLEDWETVEDLRRLCCESFRELAEKMGSMRHAKKNRTLILEIRRYVEENYSNPELSLTYLSEKFNINPKYLSKLFKEEIGDKFLDMLIRHRMEKAKQLMLETDKPIQEISEEVGYTNYNSFNRAFKNAVGVPPSDFRKQL